MIVVKAGGRVIKSNMLGLARSLASAAGGLGELVFVHGGGDIVSEVSRSMGIEPRIVTSPGGIRSRYTDEREMDVYVMTMAGRLNKSIVAALQASGAKAAGISGVDGSLLIAERKKRIVIVDERGRKRAVEGGYTGQIRRVNPEILRLLLSEGFLAVVSPIALGLEGEMLNVDGDQAAAAIARELRAGRLVFMSDVEGVYYEGEVLRLLSPEKAREYAAKVGPGMNRKLLLAAESVEEGVGEVLICSGMGDDPMSRVEERLGTLIAPRA